MKLDELRELWETATRSELPDVDARGVFVATGLDTEPARARQKLNALAPDLARLVGELAEALKRFETVGINGVVCTPPDTWSDPFMGGDGSGQMFDIDAMKCPECKAAWKGLRAALASLAELGER